MPRKINALLMMGKNEDITKRLNYALFKNIIDNLITDEFIIDKNI